MDAPDRGAHDLFRARGFELASGKGKQGEACVRLAGGMMSKERLPQIDPQSLTAEQKAAEADFVATRKTALTGPWHVFMRSPELLIHAQRMGEYLRYRCSLSGRLSELTILIVARHWTQDYEWSTHRGHAARQGVTEETIVAIAEGRRPVDLTGDESAIYEFTTELLRNRGVSDPTYAEALKRFGENGVVDLCGIIGYYQLLALTMNVGRVPPNQGQPGLSRFPFER
jgi:4-carboxymuconolactone decarboxylase